jgi:hypothetical protein
MRMRRIVGPAIAALVVAGVAAPAAGARADQTATETCVDGSGQVVVTTVVDLSALNPLNLADGHFNATPLGLTCTTRPS